MGTIKAPSGTVAGRGAGGVQFVDGEATSDDPGVLAYYARKGWTVTEGVTRATRDDDEDDGGRKGPDEPPGTTPDEPNGPTGPDEVPGVTPDEPDGHDGPDEVPDSSADPGPEKATEPGAKAARPRSSRK